MSRPHPREEASRLLSCIEEDRRRTREARAEFIASIRSAKQNGTGEKRVLIVDDNALFCTLAADDLTARLGCHVDTTSRAANVDVKNDAYDLYIVDMTMPESLALVASLRAADRAVLIVSCSTAEEVAGLLSGVGASFLSKMSGLPALVGAVSGLLGSR